MSKKSASAAREEIRPESAARKPGRWKRRVVEIVLALVLAPVVLWWAVRSLHGNQGFVSIADDEVAVHVDYARHESKVVTMPGYRVFVPWLQDVFRLDKSPNSLLMQGNTANGVASVPRLLVRANDGSSFWFEQVTIQYALIPEAAARVLEDSGTGDAFKEQLLQSHARAVLRDELGRFSAEEIARPENLRDATSRATTRLNQALNGHGIEVLEVSSSKPGFDKNYEEQIARRKLANQEVERLRAELTQLTSQRQQREQSVRYDKEIELSRLRANLQFDLAAAQKELARAKSAADLAYIETVNGARWQKVERENAAAAMSKKARAVYADAKKHAAEVEKRGEAAVRAALAAKLAGVEFTLVPYSRDPSPQRIEQDSTTAAWQKK